MMEHYEIPSQDSARETVAVEMNNFSEADNGGVSPEVVYVKVKLKGKDYMCCSVFNIMFCNCLFLGFAALICSLKVSEITSQVTYVTLVPRGNETLRRNARGTPSAMSSSES